MTEVVRDLRIDTNLRIVFLMRKYVLPIKETQAGGAVVHLASTSRIRRTGLA